MIDITFIKTHNHTEGVREGNQRMIRAKGEQHKDTYGRGCAWYAAPNYYYRRSGADCKQAEELITEIPAEKSFLTRRVIQIILLNAQTKSIKK